MTTLYILTLVCMVGAFFICGIPFGYVVAGREGVDVRKVGSGNIGMTNVARTVGGKAAGITFLGDMGKGLVSMLLARWLLATICFGGDWGMLAARGPFGICLSLVFACCVLGHVFSPYLHFHGGKGISVGFGAGLGLFWPIGLGMLVVFLAFAVPSRYISLGSIMAAISLPIQCLLWGMGAVSILPVAAVAALVVWAHRGNIKKLANHKENKFTVRHSGKGGSDGGNK